MKSLFLLLISFCNIFIFSEIYAQNNVCKDGFCIKANTERNEIYLNDINEAQCRKSPRDSENRAISLYGVKVQNLNKRSEIEENIFSDDEIDQLKKSRIYATIYINSKTKKIDAVSFIFRDMDKDEIGSIDTQKFAKYKEELKSQLVVSTLAFKRTIAEHGFVNQSFRFFFHRSMPSLGASL